MVGKNKSVKVIKSYEDLKNSKPWDFLLINGMTEMVIGESNDYLKEANHQNLTIQVNYNRNSKYTVSLEGDYIVQNSYSLSNSSKRKDKLKPYMRISFRKNFGSPLEKGLSAIAKEGGLL